MLITNLQDCLISVIDNRGVTPHKRGTEWSDSGIPVYSANNVKTSGLQKTEDIRFVPDEVYPIWMKQPLEKGDILLTSEAPAGEVYYWNSDEKIIVGQRLYGLKVKKDINSKYLKYYLQSSIGQKAIQSQQSGSTVFGISAKTFPNIVVNLPDRKKQDKIAELLYSIDKKININNRINSELESLAKTIYDYWFLQFEFPNEEGKPYKSSGGKMVWNDELKREIPDGWEYKTIAEIEPNIITGKTPSTKDETNFGEDVPFITIEDIRGNTYITNSSRKLSKKGMESQSAKNLPPESLCVSCIASIGEIGFTTCISQTNQQINSIVFENENNKEYLYFALKNHFASSNAKTGNTFANMNKKEFASIKILHSNELVSKYHKQVHYLFEMIKNNSLQNQQLASLRDFLLPMLMNGQVTFKEKDV